MDKLEKTASAMQKRGFVAKVFASAGAAKEALLDETRGLTVGFGGSITVKEMGLYEALRDDGRAVYWHWMTPKKDDPDIFEKATKADVYIASANAILEDGRILNIDGGGNRVANLAFGHKKIVIIAGKNKIVEGDLDAGIARMKKAACGRNARRLSIPSPCAANDVCIDCRSPHRVCAVTTITESKPMYTEEYIVYLVNEELGY